VVLDQRNLAFSPHMLAVRVGTSVDFPDNDRVFHNVFSFRDGRRFDLGMYPVGAVKQVTFDRAGLSRLFCNIHPNMAAYVMAVDSPYFAVSDTYGAFTDPLCSARHLHVSRPAGAPELTGAWTSTTGQPLTVFWPGSRSASSSSPPLSRTRVWSAASRSPPRQVSMPATRPMKPCQ
jgi:hypothetical protein